jgi:hypothetical protein
MLIFTCLPPVLREQALELIGLTHTAVQTVEIIPGRYAVCFLKHPDAAKYSSIAASGISYCIDDELVSCCIELLWAMSKFSHNHPIWPMSDVNMLLLQLYEPFYADFGPLNLGKTYRFCEHTKQLLQVRVRCSLAVLMSIAGMLPTGLYCSCRKQRRGVRSSSSTQVHCHRQRPMQLCW